MLLIDIVYHQVVYSNCINYANEYAESPHQARISEVAESRRGQNQEGGRIKKGQNQEGGRIKKGQNQAGGRIKKGAESRTKHSTCL